MAELGFRFLVSHWTETMCRDYSPPLDCGIDGTKVHGHRMSCLHSDSISSHLARWRQAAERKKERMISFSNANGVAYGTGSAKADQHPQSGLRGMVQSGIREGDGGGGAVLGRN